MRVENGLTTFARLKIDPVVSSRPASEDSADISRLTSVQLPLPLSLNLGSLDGMLLAPFVERLLRVYPRLKVEATTVTVSMSSNSSSK